MAPSTMKALVLGTTPNKATLIPSHSVPEVSTGQVLVKVAFAAQNPPDAFSLDPAKNVLYHDKDNIMGSDFAGTVVESKSDSVPVGSRVCGWVPGNVSRIGSYAEYLVTDADLIIKVPDGMALDESSTMGMSLMTSVHALSSWLGLSLDPRSAPADEPSPTPVLVWGGSTACGHYAIQLLKLAGYQVITTGSQRATQRLEKLGADLVCPREDIEATVKEIQTKFPNLEHAFDCFASTETTDACVRALGGKGHVHTLLPVDLELPEGVRKTFGLLHTTLGRELSAMKWMDPWPTAEQLKTDRALAARWCGFDKGFAYGLLKDKRLVPTSIQRWEGGFEGIQGALDAMAEGRVAGVKIVHLIDASQA